MKCMILAAGYATRLYPLTRTFPKPLLEVNEKTIIQWLIDDLNRIRELNEIIIISNSKFYTQFLTWQKSIYSRVPIRILNDGSTDNENRLGAVKDIIYAIRECGVEEDVIVVAGDNLLDFSLEIMFNYFKEKNASCIMRYYEEDYKRLQKTGVINIGKDDIVIEMQEKPVMPKSSWAVPPFYIYKKKDLEYILKAMEEGCEVDAPGSLIQYLCTRSKVYAMEMPGKRYDVGNLESYTEVKKMYHGIVRDRA